MNLIQVIKVLTLLASSKLPENPLLHLKTKKNSFKLYELLKNRTKIKINSKI